MVPGKENRGKKQRRQNIEGEQKGEKQQTGFGGVQSWSEVHRGLLHTDSLSRLSCSGEQVM